MDKLGQLHKPFHPDSVTFKPGVVRGNRALGLAYVGLREYMDRLDEVFGAGWMVHYQPWGEGRIIATLQVQVQEGDLHDSAWVSRSSTGESSAESERSEIGGTVAEAQAFKRACAMFGLGRYLYNLPQVWADFDPQSRQFTPAGKAQLRKAVLAHYTENTGEQVAHAQAQAEAAQAFGQGIEEDVPFYDAPPAQASAPATEELNNVRDWALHLNGSDTTPASQAQMSYLFRQFEFSVGKGTNGGALLRQLIGDAQPTKALASALIDAISRKHKPQGAADYVVNPGYNPGIVAELKQLVQKGG